MLTDLAVILSAAHFVGIFIGAHDAFLTVYEEILLIVNYDFDEGVAYLGLAIQGMSILGLIGVGFFIDRSKAF